MSDEGAREEAAMGPLSAEWNRITALEEGRLPSRSSVESLEKGRLPGPVRTVADWGRERRRAAEQAHWSHWLRDDGTEAAGATAGAFDVTAPIPGEDSQARIDRVVRHLITQHPEVNMLDPEWIEHPLQAHEALHRAVLSDSTDAHAMAEPEPTLSSAEPSYLDRIRERLSEMTGATLQPIVIDALARQVALTTRVWLRDHAYGLVHDSSEQYETLRLAERAIEGLDR